MSSNLAGPTQSLPHLDDVVCLVDQADRDLGSATKLLAHREGLLHRAVSVFLFGDGGRLLLQRRARDKYHSGGLWSNTCCGHPRPGESPAAAARRRLQEEMGVAAELSPLLVHRYRAELPDGLIEHEVDHVFIGRYSGEPRPAPTEVSDWRWQTVEALAAELRSDPERFTAWLPELLPAVRNRLAAHPG